MSNVAIFDPDELTPIQQSGMALIVRAESIEVVDQASFARAADVRREAKALIEEIVAEHKPMKQAQDAAKKVILDREKEWLEGPTQAKAIVDKKLADYEAAQRREKAISEARAAEEGRRLEAAQVKAGVAQPLPVVVPARAVQMPKVDGLGFVSHWDVVEDVEAGGRMALITAVAAGWSSAMVLEPNMPMLRDFVRVARGDFKIPGYKVVESRRPRG